MAPSVEIVWLTDALAGPDGASEQDQLTFTSLLFQPLTFGAGVLLTNVIPGIVLSILIVTEAELESPTLFVAEQVRVTPVVSEVRVDVVQPVEVLMPDSASVAVQLTVTSLLYQPFDPAVPEMDGVITGTVLSKMVASL